MSYYVSDSNLKRWLDKAQLALVSKNKVRKDLWTDLGDIIQFDNFYHAVPISSSELTTLQSFLQTEGRSESISNDSFLNWITTLHDLRKKLVREISSRAQTPEEDSSEDESDDKKSDEKVTSTPKKEDVAKTE